MAFEVNSEILRDAIQRRGWPYPADDATHLWGCRGAVPWPDAPDDGKYYLTLKENTLDSWNDTLGVFGQVFGVWKGTVDPGKPYTENPMPGTGGCAHLQDGRWQYCDGSHKGHAAFVQADEVTVWRDADEDSEQDQGEKVESGFFGIDLHGGSGEVVGEWSAGCQVVLDDTSYGHNWQAFYEAAHRTGQSSWYYWLLSASDLVPDE